MLKFCQSTSLKYLGPQGFCRFESKQNQPRPRHHRSLPPAHLGRLQAAPSASQTAAFLLCVIEFPWSRQLPALLPGRSGLHAGFPSQHLHRGDPRSPILAPTCCLPRAVPAGPGCTHHLLSPFAHQHLRDTNKPLVFALPAPGPYVLWLPPAWGFAASPALAVHVSSRLHAAAPTDPACCRVPPCHVPVHVLTPAGAGSCQPPPPAPAAARGT